jgi:4-amino-4-deoxychorismate lyase
MSTPPSGASSGTWIDGVAADSLPADDRGLAYGDGLFETVLVRNGRPRFLEAHLQRLARGCERLNIPCPSMPALRDDIAAAVAVAPPLAMLKIVITRGSTRRRGYAPQGNEVPRRLVSVWPSEPLPAEIKSGVELALASLTLGEQPALAGIKHLNRLEQVLAAGQARRAGVFDVLMRLASGEVVCGSMCNVFAVASGRLLTPPVDRAGVAGVLRGVVQRECARLGLDCAEQRLSLEQLLAADEAFITNARIGVVPVRAVGEHRFTMNSVALRLQAHVEALDA